MNITTDDSLINYIQIVIYALLAVIYSTASVAAKVEFIDIEEVFNWPSSITSTKPYSIYLVSYNSKFNKEIIKQNAALDGYLLYQTHVKVEGKSYYRLVLGNFTNKKEAVKALSKVQVYYPDSWLGKKNSIELKQLNVLALQTKTDTPAKAPTKQIVSSSLSDSTDPTNDKFADTLLKRARKKFIDRDYPRVLAIAFKVMEIGNESQKQTAFELTGIVRERQNKIAQAIYIYTDFLSRFPNSKITSKIKRRLAGLRSMHLSPKKKLAPSISRKETAEWYRYGSLSQYYRNDILDGDTNITNSLVTNINVYANKKSKLDTFVLRFDGGLVNDLIDEENNVRISRAMLDYTNEENDYQLIGGRQTRTVKGVLGRFDGFVYKGLSSPSFDYSLFTGFPVQSSFDGLETDRQFFGASINIEPSKELSLDFYLLHQEAVALIDREAIGAELQYRTDKGFLYVMVDYDLFYSDLNNITAISNYRFNDQLSFNITLDHRNSPLLTTQNAIQGQGVETLDELKSSFTEQQIYQLAEDRSSKSNSLFLGSNIKIDDRSQLYLSLSLSQVDGTPSSGGVEETPSTDDIYLSGDYSIRGYFTKNDYTNFGLRLSDTSSSETISLRARTRIPGHIKTLRYDPKLQLDFRNSKSSDIGQMILYPSLKVTYKPSKKMSFEVSLGVELSDYDLPERDDQIFYNLFLGYVYIF